jgi:hypothetical protein
MMTKSNGTEARVQVAVRARPLNQREVFFSSEIFLNRMNFSNIRLILNLQLLSIFRAHRFSLINLKRSKYLSSFYA